MGMLLPRGRESSSVTAEELPRNVAHLVDAFAEARSNQDGDQGQQLLHRLIAETEADARLRSVWARAHHELGDLFVRLRPEGTVRSLEAAIRAYQTALSVYGTDFCPEDFATVQNNLGNAHLALQLAEPQGNELWAPRAIAAFESALLIRTRESDPYGWARTQNNLGNVYAARHEGDRAKHQRRAIRAYQLALEVHDVCRHPHDFATDQTNLGLAYQVSVNGARGQNLDEAMACFLRALLIHRPEQSRRALLSLGDAFRARVELTPEHLRGGLFAALSPVVDTLRRMGGPEGAIIGPAGAVVPSSSAGGASALPRPSLFSDYYYDLHRVMPLPQLMEMVSSPQARSRPQLRVAVLQAAVDRDDVVLPSFRAMLLDELGLALLSLHTGDTTRNQEKAITAFQTTLEALTPEEHPNQWRTVQNHLAVAYHQRLSGDRGENTEQAIQHAITAKEVCKAGTPEWALAVALLGQLFRDRRHGNPQDNAKRAVEAFTSALEVWTRDTHPDDWAKTQNSLGVLYREIHQRFGGADALEAAISAFEAALTVLTPEKDPYEWAGIEFNLATALSVPVQVNSPENIERALRGLSASLEVRTKEHYPRDWARTQHNLGQAFQRRQVGEKWENLHWPQHRQRSTQAMTSCSHARGLCAARAKSSKRLSLRSGGKVILRIFSTSASPAVRSRGAPPRPWSTYSARSGADSHWLSSLMFWPASYPR